MAPEQTLKTPAPRTGVPPLRWWLRVLPCVLLVIASAVLLPACKPAPPDDAPATLAVTIADEPFTLELALDDDTRFQGLSDRDAIAPDGGMLFVFDIARPLEFVMRRCLVPIDILFLGPGGRIVAMHAMPVEADPDAPEGKLTRYGSKYPAQYVIELKDGSIARLGLSLGQEVALPQDALKRWVR